MTQMDHFLCKLHNIFDLLDPETSRALIEPSIEQLENLIMSKLQKFDVSVTEIKNHENEPQLIDDLEITIRECHEKINILENENRIMHDQLQGMRLKEHTLSLDVKLQNECELLQLENRQLRCDISEKTIIIEELTQKNHRLNKENRETRERLFTHESMFGPNGTFDNRQSGNFLRQPSGLAPRANTQHPVSYPELTGNLSMSQANIIDMS